MNFVTVFAELHKRALHRPARTSAWRAARAFSQSAMLSLSVVLASLPLPSLFLGGVVLLLALALLRDWSARAAYSGLPSPFALPLIGHVPALTSKPWCVRRHCAARTVSAPRRAPPLFAHIIRLVPGSPLRGSRRRTGPCTCCAFGRGRLSSSPTRTSCGTFSRCGRRRPRPAEPRRATRHATRLACRRPFRAAGRQGQVHQGPVELRLFPVRARARARSCTRLLARTAPPPPLRAPAGTFSAGAW